MHLGFRLRCIIAAAASVAATACSGSGPLVTPPALQSVRALQSQAGIAAHKKKCKSELFVSSFRLGYVAIYCTKGHNQAPLGKITAGISGPEGANVDAKGNLYITNTNANTVTEYAPGSMTPEFTYSGGGLGAPADVAIDKAGNAYVTTYTSSFSSGEILEYAPGTTTGTNLGIVTKEPGGITIDKAGDIVTADQGLPGVLVFPPGKTQPSKTFAQNTLDPDPVRFAKAEHQVYVGDAVGNSVYVYDYPSGTLVDTITDGIDGPNGVALDPAAPL